MIYPWKILLIPPTDLTVKFMLQGYVQKECEVIIVNKNEEKKEYFKGIFNNCNDKYVKREGNVFEDFVKDLINKK